MDNFFSLFFGFYFVWAGRSIAPHSLNKKPLKLTALAFGFAFHSLNHSRKLSILSATTRRAIDAAHSKSSHNWRDLNSIPFMYLRVIFTFAFVVLGVVSLFAHLCARGAATLNGYIASCKRLLLSIPETRRARFMTYFLRFLQKNGLNSGDLLHKAFVVTATEKQGAKAHIMFYLLQGFGGGKAPMYLNV